MTKGIVVGSVLLLTLGAAALATVGIAVVALGCGFVVGGATYALLTVGERIAVALIAPPADGESVIIDAPRALLEDKGKAQ